MKKIENFVGIDAKEVMEVRIGQIVGTMFNVIGKEVPPNKEVQKWMKRVKHALNHPRDGKKKGLGKNRARRRGKAESKS